MKLAVIGSRSFNDRLFFEEVMDDMLENHEGFEFGELISGGAKGADKFARDYAQEHEIIITEIKPDYEKYGKAAPIIRNQEIIDKCDQMLAFWDGKSRGTLDAIVKAVKQAKFVMIQGFKIDED